MNQSKFLTKVKLRKIPKRKWYHRQNYEVLEDIEYYSEMMSCVYMVPIGFITDLASTPLLLRWLLPPNGQYKYEACLHDYFYRVPEVMITRKQADKVFLEAMKVGIVDSWKEWCLYTAVKYFGGSSFKERI